MQIDVHRCRKDKENEKDAIENEFLRFVRN